MLSNQAPSTSILILSSWNTFTQVFGRLYNKDPFTIIPMSFFPLSLPRTDLRMVRNIAKSVKDWCVYDPRRIVRIAVLIVCGCVVSVQFLECFKKLQHPPKSTRTQYDINETLTYPALTFCRDPPYKAQVLAVST